MKLDDLTAKLIKLDNDIKYLISASRFDWYDDLSGIEDWEAVTEDPNKLQFMKEFIGVMKKLQDVSWTMDYFSKPVEFTSGCGIEYYCTDDEQYYDSDDDRCKPYWATSRIEHNGSNYYIVGCKKDITEVQVRYRSR